MIKNIDRRTMIAGMAATPVLAMPALASTSADPLFTAIRTHREAAGMHAAMYHGDEPRDADPRRAAWEAWLEAGSTAESDAAIELLNALGKPGVSLAGVTALMRHVHAHEFDGQVWPDAIEDDEGEEKPPYKFSENAFHIILHRECARALERIALIG